MALGISWLLAESGYWQIATVLVLVLWVYLICAGVRFFRRIRDRVEAGSVDNQSPSLLRKSWRILAAKGNRAALASRGSRCVSAALNQLGRDDPGESGSTMRPYSIARQLACLLREGIRDPSWSNDCDVVWAWNRDRDARATRIRRDPVFYPDLGVRR